MKKKSEIKVSIVIPCFKVEKYLNRCLDSLVRQTLKEIEIICINDGSPDKCIDIMKEYAKKYKEKVKIIDKNNEGLWQARIDGIKKSQGEYIGFVDADDYVDPTFVEKLYEQAKNKDADICICGYERKDEITGKVYSKEMCRNSSLTIDAQNEKGKLLEINSALWNKIYKRELFESVYELKTKPTVIEDGILLQFLYTRTKRIAFVNEPLLNYMIREGSNINTVYKDRITHTYDAMIEARNICKEKTPDFLDYFDANAFIHLGISFMLMLSNDKTLNFRDTIRKNTYILNTNFTNWKKTKYLKLFYVIKNKGTNLKPWIVKMTYHLHLFEVFILFYKFITKKLGVSIKW